MTITLLQYNYKEKWFFLMILQGIYKHINFVLQIRVQI